ncbi:PIN domain-containing protein [Algoriphagus terrigena]|uniref:PIN domain-containing protein n=1 Tax=Algoriphagus terrigena TaxID=344884 RepID=UPI00047CE614|nr:PIN domain-containing protein [Algoriphagus terrigena]
MADSYFLDSDIILDFLLKRAPFNIGAKQIFQLSFNNRVKVFVSSLAIANVHYMCTKAVGKEESLLLLEELTDLVKILSVGEKEIFSAMKSGFPDFEDAVQHFTALQEPQIKGIITRNTADYRKSQLAIYTPESFLALFK